MEAFLIRGKLFGERILHEIQAPVQLEGKKSSQDTWNYTWYNWSSFEKPGANRQAISICLSVCLSSLKGWSLTLEVRENGTVYSTRTPFLKAPNETNPLSLFEHSYSLLNPDWEKSFFGRGEDFFCRQSLLPPPLSLSRNSLQATLTI